MKSKWKWLVVTGALLAGSVAIVIFLFVKFAPDYDAMAERDFGGPAKADLLTSLYEKIEAGSPEGLGLVDLHPMDSSNFGFPKTRTLPKSLIPKECGSSWFGHPAAEGPSLVMWGEVLAHYDGEDRLQALEFYGSRYGGFVARDPGLKPVFPGELKRLKDGPIYITARITGDPD